MLSIWYYGGKRSRRSWVKEAGSQRVFTIFRSTSPCLLLLLGACSEPVVNDSEEYHNQHSDPIVVDLTNGEGLCGAEPNEGELQNQFPNEYIIVAHGNSRQIFEGSRLINIDELAEKINASWGNHTRIRLVACQAAGEVAQKLANATQKQVMAATTTIAPLDADFGQFLATHAPLPIWGRFSDTLNYAIIVSGHTGHYLLGKIEVYWTLIIKKKMSFASARSEIRRGRGFMMGEVSDDIDYALEWLDGLRNGTKTMEDLRQAHGLGEWISYRPRGGGACKARPDN